MTTQTRIERSLPGILDELSAGPTPEYLDDVFMRTSRMRQRPAWTFPERWLPMSDITRPRAFAFAPPWRTVAAALLILALLLALAVAFVGSRQQRVPAPFGVARNGVMAYGAGGDISALDPATGKTTPLVFGPETDRLPMFSRDGTRLAFFRQVGTGSTYDLVVANSDGTDQRVVNSDPVTFDMSINWAADGRSILVDDIHGHLTRVDAVGSAPPVKTAYQGVADIIALRPPDEAQLLYRTVTAKGWSLWVMDVDGTHAHPLLSSDAASMRDDDYVGYTWSPDGSKIAFRMHPDASDDARLFVVNADGTGLRRLTHGSGTGCECDMFWSPDGTQIAFNRWQIDPGTGEWHGHPVALASVADGSVRDIGPLPPDDRGAEFAFSPDGTSLVWLPRPTDSSAEQPSKPILLNIADGATRTVDVFVDSGRDWQRVALP